MTQINLTNPVKGIKEFNILDMKEYNGELLLTLKDRECYHIYPGQQLSFKRYVYYDKQYHIQLSTEVTVLNEDENHIIHTTIPYNEPISIFNNEENIKVVNGVRKNENNVDEEYEYHILKTTTNHNIFFQDIGYDGDIIGDGQEIYVKDINGNLLGSFSGITIPLKRSDEAATTGDCLTLISEEETCGKSHKKVSTFQYDFLHERISRNKIIVHGFDESIINNMSYIETKFNPFYWYYTEKEMEKIGDEWVPKKDKNGNFIPSELDEYGNPVKHCSLYEDYLWNELKTIDLMEEDTRYVNYGLTKVVVGLPNSYWDVNINLSTPVNETSLGSEDNFNTSFINDLQDSLIPQFIDMERVKYSPMVYNSAATANKLYKWIGINPIHEIYTRKWISDKTTERYGDVISIYNNNNIKIGEAIWMGEYLEMEDNIYYPTGEIIREDLTEATGLTFNFHFRERAKVTSATCTNNTTLTSGNVYYDGWYIDTVSGETTWWNEMNYNGETFNLNTFRDYITNNGEKSDLIGYLNFTDNDIYYRKKKVSQSFIRLTFYTSNDPLTQKLLFYSTVFLDGNVLYGKYIKQLFFMKENNLMKHVENENAAVVMCSAITSPSRVDTQINITNEYDRTRSSEGFNLYLFADDVNVNRDENGERTIYMKVEFNHAGNGKTIPMIMWPKDKSSGNYCALTIGNFINSLYIPIKISYFNGKYVYYIPDAFKNENGGISLVLFEPKLDVLEELP